MIVCLDSGNSRIKWGVHDGRQWLAQGAVAQSDVARLAELPAQWPGVTRVMLANVAGVAVGEQIRQHLAPWSGILDEVRSTAEAAGVTNGYDHPERLGVDRWCALIGARSLVSDACVVVMAGTATTVDMLDAQGHFLGGLILPGVGMMLQALSGGTAGLPFARGQVVAFPRCTDDAIMSGVLDAQAGAIERVMARVGPSAICLLSGGNAEQLVDQLVIPCRLAHNLPLEGLRQLAGSDH